MVSVARGIRAPQAPSPKVAGANGKEPYGLVNNAFKNGQAATSNPPLATVFGSRLSPFVEVVRTLKLEGFRISLVQPKSPADFRHWNPQTGKMPVLEIDGEHVYDSTFILRRLGELCPQPPLFDEDPVIATRQRFLEDRSDESLYRS